MSKMGDLMLELEQAILESKGEQSIDSIAKEFGVPTQWVEDAYDNLENGGYGEFGIL